MRTKRQKEIHRKYLEEERMPLPTFHVRDGQSPLIGDICVRWKRLPESTSDWADLYIYTGRVLDVLEGHVLVETYVGWWYNRYDVVHSRQMVPLSDFAQFWTLPNASTRASLCLKLSDAFEAERFAEEFPPELAVIAALEGNMGLEGNISLDFA